MTVLIEWISQWLAANPRLAPFAMWAGMILLSILFYLIGRFIIARALSYAALRTENKYDDLLVAKLHPFRFAWIAPLVVIHYAAEILPGNVQLIRQVTLFIILWLFILLINNILDAVNAIYEATPLYSGNSIQGYLDLAKILLVSFAVILTISIFTGQDPWVLLSGLGAIMAILLLVFRDTLLSLVASLQIQSNELLKEGDWIEVPSYNADGIVINITLHLVKVQNSDRTITAIPTYKLLDAPYKNWRGMHESGARRFKRSLFVDVHTIGFVPAARMKKLARLDLLADFLQAHPKALRPQGDDPFSSGQITNLELFRVYAQAYLRGREDVWQEGMPLAIMSLAPTPQGLPLEITAFTHATDWEPHMNTQVSIFNHLIAALPEFGLRLFQQPSGLDFQQGLAAAVQSGEM